LLCFIFLYFAASGAGRWSMDHWIAHGRRRPSAASPTKNAAP
jgi:hypothetical protein